jgi:hypothetical protein
MNNAVKIIWNDAVVFSPHTKNVRLSRMETTGILEKDTEKYVIIREPKTIRQNGGKTHPDKTPNFYIIPRGMIISIIPL